ncbi:exonuclease SbcC [Gracilibacillus ureilyticus]|uniref:Nuclease SbcCD subunit C n=1 Tax=Gracilibacillus ureilyticus TaxID=531814 RepID=A0A1H9LK03_9BACI|nr:AAA family ATPase [Gracilibacillus ureilyticus]SER11720.1 exonuclease SbcC [Gracilibacillus ureilyticus]
MRILTLELTAFGPYRNKQLIDFTKLEEETIFLITGPTGAGKTSLFDAICYSLYGRASGTDRDQDTFRSHFATIDDLTSVTLTFSLHQKIYRVTRSPKQQKPKARGEGYTEEPANASLYQLNNDQNWDLLESKIKEVNESLQEMINLDYEQFRKMIMIPQGEFRKLISENSKEREEVLQKIFRTYFYRDMTEKMKHDAKLLKEQIEKLEWKLQQEHSKISAELLEVQEGQSLVEQLESKIEKLKVERERIKQNREQLIEQQERLEKEYYEKKQIVDLFCQLDEKRAEMEQMNKQEPLIREKKEILHFGELANQLLPLEDQLKSREEEWQEQTKRHKELQEQLLRKKEQFMQVEERYHQLEKESETREQMRTEIEKKNEGLKKFAEYLKINQKSAYLSSTLKEKQQKIHSLEKTIEQLTIEKERSYQLNEEIHQFQQTIQEETYNKENWERRLLICEDIINEANLLDGMRKEYLQINNEISKLHDQVEKQKEKCHQIEQGYHRNIAQLLASTLEDGKACPVCGSTSHSQVNNNETNVTSQHELEEERQVLQKLEEDCIRLERKKYEIKEQGEAKKSIIARYYQSLEQSLQDMELNDLHKKMDVYKNQQMKREQKIQESREALAALKTSRKDVHVIQQTIDRKKDERNELSNNVNQQMEQLKQLQIKLATLDNQLPEDVTSLEEYQQQVEQLEKEYQVKMEQWKESQQQFDGLKQELTEIYTITQQTEQFEQQLRKNYDNQLVLFKKSLKEKNFDSIEAYKNALISEKEQKELSETIEKYEEKRKINEQRIEEISAALKDEEQPDLQPLKESMVELNDKQISLSKEEQSIEWTLKQLQQTIKTVKTLEKDLETVSDEYYHIGELASLAKGDNPQRLSFERFVLSTFLDEILLQANIRLDKMTDHRFQLIRSEEVAKRGAQSGLDLEVLDHYTGRKRSVKTLSGGEGFKAALSLALGMADIIQSHSGGVQLDTLFIDEGFGTLDEVSLEQAIDCLKDLQQDHRVIGVISHVTQLKEAIKAKLVIQSSNEGSSAQFVLH